MTKINKGSIMKLTILGTGCAWTKRECASYLLNDNIMIDPGYGSIKQLLKTNDQMLHHEKIETIDLVLITHFHSDHYFDMPYILQKEATGKLKNKKLTIIAPPGVKEKLDELCKLAISQHSYNKIDMDKYCNIYEAGDGKEFDFGKYHIRCVLLDHNDTVNYGYMIKLPNGKILSFSGDTTNCDNMMYMVNHSDIILLNMANTKKDKSHYNIIDGIELMKQYKGKCIIIPAHMTSESYDYAKTRINIPKDLMQIDLDKDIPYDFELKNKPIINVAQDIQLKEKEFNAFKLKDATLKLVETISPKGISLPAYCYNIYDKKDKLIGDISVSIGYNIESSYIGNILYHIDENYLDKPILYEAFLQMAKIAKSHDMDKIYISTSPKDDYAKKLCIKLGAKLKEMRYFSERNRIWYNLDDQNRCIWSWEIGD